ncbi:hypothetical protein [Endozoicomonas sp. SCSIO W0465]|uniref:hypothetical protein n=1 Tax=Endozoicomonas sp. SCSIO W0465 TaxID=2918516 RepID=UPI0020763FEF|nr:hypothetical protein [Endozoicomonas sp. SCSIO W0465]USE37026.1 hypothetical protein MJO57_01970 [Endozoicomonas sp. SCSIO W0465]
MAVTNRLWEVDVFSSVSEAHDRLVEQVIEVDDGLMDLYLEQGQSIEPPQLHDPFEQCLREGHLLPVCFVSARTGAGVDQLLRIMSELMPTPEEGNAPQFCHRELKKDDSKMGEPGVAVSVTADPEAHTIALFSRSLPILLLVVWGYSESTRAP